MIGTIGCCGRGGAVEVTRPYPELGLSKVRTRRVESGLSFRLSLTEKKGDVWLHLDADDPDPVWAFAGRAIRFRRWVRF
jgi:hypothetical protein